MKKRNLRYLFLLALSGQVFFSCNTARHYEFANHGPAYKTGKVNPAMPQNNLDPVNTSTTTARETDAPAAEAITASTEIAPLAAKPLVDLKSPAASREAQVLSAPTPTEIAATKITVNATQKKEIKNALKQFRKQNIQDNQETAKPAVDIVELIFAILLPPVGVLLHEGGLNSRFWISLLLTLLFFFPGMIYAILVVTDTI